VFASSSRFLVTLAATAVSVERESARRRQRPEPFVALGGVRIAASGRETVDSVRLPFERQERRSRKASDECLHGVVTWAAAQDGAGQSQDAQLGDIEASRRRLETVDGGRQATVHRRGQEAASSAPQGTSGLQVPTEAQSEGIADQERQIFHDARWRTGRRRRSGGDAQLSPRAVPAASAARPASSPPPPPPATTSAAATRPTAAVPVAVRERQHQYR